MNEKTKKFMNLKSITIVAVLIALLAIGSAIAFFTSNGRVAYSDERAAKRSRIL